MSIENRIIQGIDQDGKAKTVNVVDGNVTSLHVVGDHDHLLKELLVQQKITNTYLLILVGDSNKIEEGDIQ